MSGTPKHGEGELRRDGDDEPTQLATRQTATTGTQEIPDLGLELVPGVMLGEYRIEEKIGEGGMGVVFLAVHPKIGKRAAIKVLKRELCEDQYTVERFQDEARVVNEIGHPNIVDVFAFGEMPGGRRYFVMEWLRGETLRARIARTRTPLADVCGILRPLARALEAAHDKGIIHRDLKPDNVFLVENREGAPTVKLLDFGIAKLAHSSEPRLERTATGAMVGTPMYIAPEQARGHAIDHRVDIYSLGAIAFELLTGRTPFLADNAMEMVAKHLMEAPPTISSVWPQVPRALDEIVTRMLAKNAVDRPSLSVLCAVLDEVKTWDGSTPPRTLLHVAAAAPSALVDVPPSPRASRRWLPIAIALPIIGAGAWLVLGSGSGSKPRANATTGTPVVTPIDPPAVISADATVVVGSDAAVVVVAPPDASLTPEHHDMPHPAATPRPAPPKTSRVTLLVPNARTAEVLVDGEYAASVSNGRAEFTVSFGRGHRIELRGPDGASVTVGLTPQKPAVSLTMGLPPVPPPPQHPVTVTPPPVPTQRPAPVTPTPAQKNCVDAQGLMIPGCLEQR